MERGCERQRDQGAEAPADQERQRRADREPRERADAGQEQGLPEIDREHAATGRPERLERRDHVAFAIQVPLDRVGHTDAADQKRRQSDQREILSEALDIALERGRSVAAAADLPPGLGQARFRGSDDTTHRALARFVVGKLQAVVPAHQAAGLQEPGRAQRLFAHQEARSKSDAARELVGLRSQNGAQLDGSGADGHARTGRQVEPRQERRIGCGTIDAARARQRSRQRLRRLERNRPEQRIGRIDRLELDQGAAPIVDACHGAHGGGGRHATVLLEKRAFRCSDFAVTEIERQVAAQDGTAFAR